MLTSTQREWVGCVGVQCGYQEAHPFGVLSQNVPVLLLGGGGGGGRKNYLRFTFLSSWLKPL